MISWLKLHKQPLVFNNKCPVCGSQLGQFEHHWGDNQGDVESTFTCGACGKISYLQRLIMIVAIGDDTK